MKTAETKSCKLTGPAQRLAPGVMVHGLLADANTMVMVVATTNLWLTKGDDTCSKATQDQDKVDN